MPFSSSSYFAGVATAFVAVAVGFAGGAMVTTSPVQSPNRLERVTSRAPLPPSPSDPAPERPHGASSQPDATSVRDAAAPPPPATAPRPAADSQPAGQPASATPALNSGTEAKTDAAAANVQPAPASSAKRESAAPSKNERTSARSNDSRRGTYRGRSEDRKFVERKRQQDLDEATNAVRQLPRDNAAVIVEREDSPRLAEERAPRPGFFGIEDGPPRPRGDAPPRFGFFGND
jgi:hypothetical protein